MHAIKLLFSSDHLSHADNSWVSQKNLEGKFLLAVLGLPPCMGFFLVSGGCSLAAAPGLLIAAAPGLLIAAPGLLIAVASLVVDRGF